MNIILAVSGSIAAYKSYDLCRELSKKGHSIKVILTSGALKFVKKEVFTYLGAARAYGPMDDFNTDHYSDFTVLHIELTKWADRIIIAPTSANTLAKLSLGLADDLLTTTFLAFRKSILIFPAMNSFMLSNKIVEEHFEKLKKLENVYIHSTKTGELACGDRGPGKLEELSTILELCEFYPLSQTHQHNEKTLLITTGATISPLDPVRFITNPSSGQTGAQIAKVYLSQGYNVVMVAGQSAKSHIQSISNFPRLTLIEVMTTKDMLCAVEKYFDKCDTFIASAAPSDIEFKTSSAKISKQNFNELPTANKAPDILGTMIKRKRNQKIVGFCAQTEDLIENMQKKIISKPCDLLIGNAVSNGVNGKRQGFAENANDYTLYFNEEFLEPQRMNKSELAQRIFSLVEKI